jgi:hypothetical protein
VAYQSEIELRVKVVAKELNDLEQRINKIQTQAKSVNPFTASGASRGLKQQEKALRLDKLALDVDKNRLKLNVDLNNERIKALNLNTSWYKALETGKQIQLDINKAVANEAKLRAKTRRAAIGRKATDIATGFGFPLLFGGGVGQAVAGGLGGAVGGLGGSIAASAVVSQVQALFDSFGELAAAMDQPVQLLEELADKGFDVGASTKSYVEALESQGRFAEAAAVANKELNKALGKGGVEAVQRYKEEQDKLEQATTKLALTIFTQLGPAVTAFIGYVTDIINNLPGAKAAELARTSPESTKGVAIEAAERFGKKQSQNLFAGIFSDMFDFAGAGAAVEYAKELDRVSAETLESLGKQQTEQKGTADTLREQLEILRKRASLRAYELPRIQQEEQFLKRELEIMRMTGPLQQMEKQTAEALLKADQARFNLLQARQELRKQERSPEFDGIKELKLLKEVEEAAANSRRAEVEAEIAVEAERVYDFYMAQANALKGLVQQSRTRLDREKATLEGRNKLTGAYYSAELKVNKLAIQRAKQKGNINKALGLELKQANLVYKETLAQIKAEVEKARLKADQVRLEARIAEAKFLEKKATEGVNQEDRDALQARYDAVKLADKNLDIQKQVADEQVRGAEATRKAAEEAAKYAANQERAAKAAKKTKDENKKAAENARTGSFPGIGSTGNLVINKIAKNIFAGELGRGGRNLVTGLTSQALQVQLRLQRALARKQAFDQYNQQARELRRLGVTGVPQNPYRNYRTATYTSPFGSLSRGFAEGGYVDRPTDALIGERGESEYVIPESKMGNAIKRYARGARGESVVEGSSETSAAGKKRSGAIVNISTGPVMQMDGQDYVTVSDLNDAVGNVAAAMSSSDEGYGSSARVS